MNEELAKRRQQVLNAIGDKNIGIIIAKAVCERNHDNNFPYRPDSDFYYLTGFSEPEAVMVLVPGRKEGEFILFNRPRDPEQEVWVGPRAGQEGAVKEFAADQSFPISALAEWMPKLLENRERVYYNMGHDDYLDEHMRHWVSKVQAKVRSGVNAPSEFVNIDQIVHEMRLIKSPAELDNIRKACKISADAIVRAMQKCKPGMMEYALEGEIRHEYCHRGGREVAYPPIIGAGANSCVLHYNDNNSQINDGDIVLIDAGVEYQYYASDITRSFPANGKFTEAQRKIYQVVLNAQEAVIDAVKPKMAWIELQQISDREITRGLVEMGLLSGDVNKLIADNAQRKFYLHRIGHWMGLDVHDVGQYRIKGEWRKLQAGMVFTVEPGIYIPAGSKDVDKKWWNIGVRIEDDVLVTDNGCEVLTKDVPKGIDEIETLMAGVVHVP